MHVSSQVNTKKPVAHVIRTFNVPQLQRPKRRIYFTYESKQSIFVLDIREQFVESSHVVLQSALYTYDTGCEYRFMKLTSFESASQL